MPFSTDVTWPEGLRTIFDICSHQNESFQNRYYGPYNKLLNYCVGESFQYFVAPQNPPSDLNLDPRDTVDSIVFFVVFDADRRPVLIAEVKDGGWNTSASLRLSADEQMRRRYDHMLADCPIPRLWGLSLLGTSLRVYCADHATGRIEPRYEGRPSLNRVLPRDHLEGAWNIDILSQQGFNKMKEIVGDILTSTPPL